MKKLVLCLCLYASAVISDDYSDGYFDGKRRAFPDHENNTEYMDGFESGRRQRNFERQQAEEDRQYEERRRREMEEMNNRNSWSD